MKILSWERLGELQRQQVLRRPVLPENEDLQQRVRDILAAVKLKGDSQLIAFTNEFDGINLKQVALAADPLHIIGGTTHPSEDFSATWDVTQSDYYCYRGSD